MPQVAYFVPRLTPRRKARKHVVCRQQNSPTKDDIRTANNKNALRDINKSANIRTTVLSVIAHGHLIITTNIWHGMIHGFNVPLDTLEAILEMIYPASHFTGAKTRFTLNQTANKLHLFFCSLPLFPAGFWHAFSLAILSPSWSVCQLSIIFPFHHIMQ